MTLLEAQTQFNIRYYRWALIEAEKEVNESFPALWLFKGGLTWDFYQFIRQLRRADQIIFLRGLIKRYHRAAAEALGVSISGEEEALFTQFRNFRPVGGFERELLKRRKAGEEVKLASKAKLRKAVSARFQQAFTDQQMGANIAGDLRFEKNSGTGWVVNTDFWFGRQECLISYTHLICSEEKCPDPNFIGPAKVLASMLCWTGMYNLEWKYLLDEDVEPACNSVVDLCVQFFDVLPKLLDGLDYDKITHD